MIIDPKVFIKSLEKYPIEKLYEEKENLLSEIEKFENRLDSNKEKLAKAIVSSETLDTEETLDDEIYCKFYKEYVREIDELINLKKKQMDSDIYCYLKVLIDKPDIYKAYYYLTEDYSIEEDDRVIVDFNGEETEGTVVEVDYYKKDDVPFPLERTKKIKSKVEDESDLVEIEEMIDKNDVGQILYIAATSYEKGEYNKAVEYYRIAMAMGSIDAVCSLGYCFFYGRGVKKDYRIARYYFNIARKYGSINATYKLGDMYMHGFGVKEDENIALGYYIKAYEDSLKEKNNNISDPFSYPDICFRMGYCYYEGIGGYTNKNKALELFNEAEKYFKIRIAEGDGFSSQILEITEDYIKQIKEEINEEN